MKMKTFKKALSLFLAVLMIALAIPFTLLTVAAEEPGEVKITDFSVFGRHCDENGNIIKNVEFYDENFTADKAFDENKGEGAEAQTKNGGGTPYEMCYFDKNGVKTYGVNPDEDGKSYLGIFVVELLDYTDVTSFSLWTPYYGNEFMANNGYDIYYSVDGDSYAAVENASFSDVYATYSYNDGSWSLEQKNYETNGFYVKDPSGETNYYVHNIPMGDVTAKYIAIAVTDYIHDPNYTTSKEMIFNEIVVTGTSATMYLESGASVRMDAPTGLRFTGLVSKSYVDGLKSEGKTVTMGMLITPTNYLDGIEFTKVALNDKTFGTPAYLEIDAAEETVKEDGDYYVIKCVIAKIKEANYDREFSAILYVKVDGEIVAYSDYNEVFNSRSVAEVAEAAYCDLKDAKDDTYKYEIKTFEGEAEVTKYSRYDTTQRETLYGFFCQREQ